MCLLIAAEKFPSRELLELGNEQNSHGMGIGFYTKEGIRYYKGLDFDQLMLFQSLKTPMIIHFRLATHGGIRPELCHPFPISDKVELSVSGLLPFPKKADEPHGVLGHNGVVSNWKDVMFWALSQGYKMPPGEHWSDTRGVTFAVNAFGKDVLHIIDGKFAVVDRDGISRYGDWKQLEDGTWVSYDPFLRKSSRATVGGGTNSFVNNNRNNNNSYPQTSSSFNTYGNDNDNKNHKSSFSPHSHRQYTPSYSRRDCEFVG